MQVNRGDFFEDCMSGLLCRVIEYDETHDKWVVTAIEQPELRYWSPFTMVQIRPASQFGPAITRRVEQECCVYDGFRHDNPERFTVSEAYLEGCQFFGAKHPTSSERYQQRKEWLKKNDLVLSSSTSAG